MDFIVFVFYMFNTEGPPYMCKATAKEINEAIDNAIKERNYRFKQHSFDYGFLSGEIIRIDNKVVHQAIVKPLLKLLYEEGFDGAKE